MLTMQAFHTLLSNASSVKDAYASAMSAVTSLSADKLSSLASDLYWDYWMEETEAPTNA